MGKITHKRIAGSSKSSAMLVKRSLLIVSTLCKTKYIVLNYTVRGPSYAVERCTLVALCTPLAWRTFTCLVYVPCLVHFTSLIGVLTLLACGTFSCLVYFSRLMSFTCFAYFTCLVYCHGNFAIFWSKPLKYLTN